MVMLLVLLTVIVIVRVTVIVKVIQQFVRELKFNLVGDILHCIVFMLNGLIENLD